MRQLLGALVPGKALPFLQCWRYPQRFGHKHGKQGDLNGNFFAAVSIVISQGGAAPRVGCGTENLLRPAQAVYRYVPSYGCGTIPWDFQWDWGYVAPRYTCRATTGLIPALLLHAGARCCRNKRALGAVEQLTRLTCRLHCRRDCGRLAAQKRTRNLSELA
jgi:hypothetical protein